MTRFGRDHSVNRAFAAMGDDRVYDQFAGYHIFHCQKWFAHCCLAAEFRFAMTSQRISSVTLSRMQSTSACGKAIFSSLSSSFLGAFPQSGCTVILIKLAGLEIHSSSREKGPKPGGGSSARVAGKNGFPSEPAGITFRLECRMLMTFKVFVESTPIGISIKAVTVNAVSIRVVPVTATAITTTKRRDDCQCWKGGHCHWRTAAPTIVA